MGMFWICRLSSKIFKEKKSICRDRAAHKNEFKVVNSTEITELFIISLAEYCNNIQKGFFTHLEIDLYHFGHHNMTV